MLFLFIGEDASALPKGLWFFLYALRYWNSDAAAFERERERRREGKEGTVVGLPVFVCSFVVS